MNAASENDARLGNAIDALERERKILEQSGASFIAHLLGLAVLELRLSRHDVSDQEFAEICDLIEKQIATQDTSLPATVARLDDYRKRRALLSSK